MPFNSAGDSEYAQNYQSYVQSLYKPSASKESMSQSLSNYADDPDSVNISPSMQLKHYGDDVASIPTDPLRSIYEKYQIAPAPLLDKPAGLSRNRNDDDDSGPAPLPSTRFAVYQPKQSSEYHWLANRKLPPEFTALAKTQQQHGSVSRAKYPNFDYRISSRSGSAVSALRTPGSIESPTSSQYYQSRPSYYGGGTARQGAGAADKPRESSTSMLIDYQDFQSGHKPISEYLYLSHPYIKKGDTRILGSNFMMVSLRGPDAWFGRVDKLLDDAKNC